MKMSRVLCVIPARGGSKRIRGKNIRSFGGKPLIARAIAQAFSVSFIDRVIVDTDDAGIARIAKRFGAEVPFLRPARLAGDTAQIAHSVAHLLGRLAKEGYHPEYVVLLQPTSPFRKPEDIEACWKKMQEGGATTVLTVCPSHPQLYHLGPRGELSLANARSGRTSNTQSWEPGYILNGSFVYLVRTGALLKEKRLLTEKTRAVVLPRWRSVDIDTPEDWVMAEMILANEKAIDKKIKNFK